MPSTQNFFERLEHRRQELGISQAVLAERSGVSLPTVHRVLTGKSAATSFEHVLAIARALGMEPQPVTRVRPAALLRQQALRKAKELIGHVQGTSALESQGLSRPQITRMIRRTAQELLAGSRRRLWSR